MTTVTAGQRFGEWEVLESSDNQASHTPCKCSCGTLQGVLVSSLLKGLSQGCRVCGISRGWAKRKARYEALVSHPSTKSFPAEYAIWVGMHARCKRDPRYAGRGILVSPEWACFWTFLRDMGLRPEGLSIDRKDNDLGYSKSNCRWATRVEQSNNKSSRLVVSDNGELVKKGYKVPLPKTARLGKSLSRFTTFEDSEELKEALTSYSSYLESKGKRLGLEVAKLLKSKSRICKLIKSLATSVGDSLALKVEYPYASKRLSTRIFIAIPPEAIQTVKREFAYRGVSKADKHPLEGFNTSQAVRFATLLLLHSRKRLPKAAIDVYRTRY